MPIRHARLLVLIVLTAGLLLPAGVAVAQEGTPDPTVEGPIGDVGIHGHALWDSWFDLTELGYEEAEYFVSGTATSDDGTSTAPYTTRIIVTRPADPADFNGAVLLDWVNVTAQFENAVDSIEAHEYLLREGWAYVHVSAQQAGLCCTPLTPKVWDPVRYAPIDHPGDAYANAMFSQIARAIDAPAGLDVLAGLAADRRLIAAGQSQGAGRLSDYVRTVQPDVGIVDGFLIHSLGSKQFDQAPAVPVLHLLSDFEADPSEPTHPGDNYRLWEYAGASHSDFWVGYHQEVGQGPRFAGAPKQPASADEDLHEVAGNYGEQPHPMHATCILAGSAFPVRYAVAAALDHLDRWVVDGTVPPAAPRYAFDATGLLARDEHGNALGGVRLAPVEVPVAEYRSTACGLGGVTVPFDDATLQGMYPTHADYYARTAEVTAANVRDGSLLAADARDFLARACAMRNRWGEPAGDPCEIPSFEAAEPPALREAPPPDAEPERAPLPATGGGLAPIAILLVAVAAGTVRSVRLRPRARPRRRGRSRRSRRRSSR